MVAAHPSGSMSMSSVPSTTVGSSEDAFKRVEVENSNVVYVKQRIVAGAHGGSERSWQLRVRKARTARCWRPVTRLKRYEGNIQQELARGAFGVVHEGRHVLTGAEVAIKIYTHR